MNWDECLFWFSMGLFVANCYRWHRQNVNERRETFKYTRNRSPKPRG